MDTGKILKELRVEANLTQSELSKRLSVGQSTIFGYEKCEREATVANLIKYARYFNVSLDYLTGLEDDFGNRTQTDDFAKHTFNGVCEKGLADFIKLYEALTEIQKAQVRGYMTGILENGGTDVKKLLKD